MKKDQYNLMVGSAGAERLNLLNYFCNPFTFRLLNQLGNLSGKNVLDLACGTGIITCELAKRVGHSGKVIAVDASPEQLMIAKQNAQNHDLKNIQFVELAAQNLAELTQQFDLIYCRFLLVHLQDPFAVVKAMASKLKPKGILFCEEPTNDAASFCYPASEIFERYRHAIIMQHKLLNPDITYGLQLPRVFSQLGLKLLTAEISQPLLLTAFTKNFLWLHIKEVAAKLINKNILTKTEVQTLIEDLQQFAKEDNYASFVQYMQIIGQKAA